MKTWAPVMLLAGASVVLGGCGGKKKDTPDPSRKNAKFTIQVTGLGADYDDALLVVTGGRTDLAKTLWKVNGTVRNNEPNLTIDRNQLRAGGTFVVESVVPLDIAQVAVTGQNFDAPFTITFKSEINGQVKENFTQTVTQTFDKNLSY